HLQAVRAQARAGVVAQGCFAAVELAADVGTGQADRTLLAGTGGGEPFGEKHALADVQAVSMKRGAVAVAQGRSGAVELAADPGTGQAHRAGGAKPGGGEPACEVNAPANLQAIGDQGGTGVVGQLRPCAVEVAAGVGADQADR